MIQFRGISALLVLLALAGCGSLDAHRARTRLIGATEPDVIACMGVPASKQFISTDQHVLQWDYAQTGDDVDLTLGIYAVKLGRPGICHASLRFSAGRVQSVHFTGTVITATDPDSVCGNLVHDCLWHRETTPLPPDFSSTGILAGPTITVKQGAKAGG
jgi:hypothetical protein